MNASTTARGSTRGSTRARTATAITLSTLVVGAALTTASTAEAAQSAASSSAATAATAAAQVSTRPIADPTPPPSTRILRRVRLAATPVQIVNTYSNLAADVIGGNTAAGTGTWLWPRTGSQAQLVDLLPTDSGYFRIRVRHSGQCLMLDWRTGAYTDGTKIVQHPYCNTGYNPSQWRAEYVRTNSTVNGVTTPGLTYMRLVNRSTGRCLDADNPRGFTPPEQARLQQWRCLPTTGRFGGNQSWDILRHGQNRAD